MFNFSYFFLTFFRLAVSEQHYNALKTRRVSLRYRRSQVRILMDVPSLYFPKYHSLRLSSIILLSHLLKLNTFFYILFNQNMNVMVKKLPIFFLSENKGVAWQ